MLNPNRLLSAGVSAVLSQPRRQLRFLLRFQVQTVVDALDRLFVGTFTGRYLVRVEEIRYLIAQSRIAEAAGSSDYFVAGKRAAHFLQFRPVLPNEIPSQSLSGRICQHVRHKLKRILRTYIRRNRKIERALQQLWIAESSQSEEVGVVLFRRLGLLQP